MPSPNTTGREVVQPVTLQVVQSSVLANCSRVAERLAYAELSNDEADTHDAIAALVEEFEAKLSKLVVLGKTSFGYTLSEILPETIADVARDDFNHLALSHALNQSAIARQAGRGV